jgi:hypothetical protein
LVAVYSSTTKEAVVLNSCSSDKEESCLSNTGNEPHQKELDVKPHYGRLQKSFYSRAKRIGKERIFSLGTRNSKNPKRGLF